MSLTYQILHNIICMLYVDNSIFLSPKDSIIDKHFAVLKDLNFDLTNKGGIEAYLGIKVQRDNSGHTKMAQPGFTETFLTTLGLESSSKTHDTLHTHKNGTERTEKWNYRSVIALLIYLARNTCPDKEYAIHQCACSNSIQKRHTKMQSKGDDDTYSV